MENTTVTVWIRWEVLKLIMTDACIMHTLNWACMPGACITVNMQTAKCIKIQTTHQYSHQPICWWFFGLQPTPYLKWITREWVCKIMKVNRNENDILKWFTKGLVTKNTTRRSQVEIEITFQFATLS